MTQLRQRVERLESAETTSLHFGASANAISSFPGMVNIVAGSGVSFTPGTGTLTITATGGGGTVTSVGVSGSSGIGVSGSPITGSGTITLSLGAITPTSVSTGALTASGAISLPAQSITRANLVNGTACTVIGRSANSTGAVADISMGTNDRLLGRVSNVVKSTQLTAGMFPNNVVSNAILRQGAAKSVIGVTGNATANVADIAGSGARTFLAVNSANTALAFRAIDSGDFPTGNWIGATNGQTVSAGVSLAADSTWYTVADVSLAAGTYLVLGSLRANIAVSAGTGYCVAEMYNATSASSISNSQSLVVLLDNTLYHNCTNTIFSLVTIGSTSTIRLRAKRESIGATWVASTVSSDSNGYSKITAIRIA